MLDGPAEVVIVFSIMRIASVADLRNHFRRVSAWIDNGESVEIVKRGRAFAKLVPARSAEAAHTKVDWAAQAREIWRGRVFGAAEAKAMDAFECEGEEG